MITAVLLALSAIGPLQAQRQDSAAIRERARAAQARFERARRAHLPFTPPSAGRAEERIGRFRYWHDDGAAPPPEPAAARAAREQLLRVLDSAAALHPGDPWIAGQRVRYLVEHGAADRAREAARTCAARRWWCRALEGLAHHAAGDVAAAETAFGAALEQMPDEHRCRWTDASDLLEGRFARRYRALPCADRAGWDQRLWWLARPLFLLPGNDRWTEHLARMTLADILSEAGNAYGIRWGDDLREITVRFGWPVAWSAETPRLGGMGEITVVGHQGSPSVHFIPASGALEEPYAAGEGDWELRAPAPRERYAPAYADSFVAFPHQAAVFRRGESTLVVAAYELPGEAGFAGDSLAVALVLASGPGQAPVIARSSRPDGVLLAVAPAGALVLSLEALSRPARRVARARYALPTPAATPVTLSDLLLFDPADSVPPELSRVLERALPSGDLGARRRVGVYWEVYRRHGGAEPLRLDLAVRRTGGGILRRAARAVGLAEPEQPVRLEWEEVPAFESGRVARALFLDLSALGRGRYRIELTVRPADQPPLTVARDLRLGAPARP